MPQAALPPSRLSHCPPRPQSPRTPTTDAAGELSGRYPVSMRVTAMTLHRVSVGWVFSSGFSSYLWVWLAGFHAAVTRHVHGAVVERPGLAVPVGALGRSRST